MLAKLKHAHYGKTLHQWTGAKRAGFEAWRNNRDLVTRTDPQTHSKTNAQHNAKLTCVQIC